MTTNAARLLGVDKQRGAIKAGQAADIITTPGTHLKTSKSSAGFVRDEEQEGIQTGRFLRASPSVLQR